MGITRRTWGRLAIVILTVICPSNDSEAQHRPTVAVVPNVSTLGFGSDVVIGLSRTVAIRAGGHWVNLRPRFDEPGVSYHVNLDWKSLQMLVDIHPWQNVMRLSTGALWNGNRMDVLAMPAQSISVFDRVYQPEEIGSVSGTVDFGRATPYLGIGLGNQGDGLNVDLGLAMQGRPRQSYSRTTSLTGTDKTMFDRMAQAETDRVQSTIADAAYLRFYPVLSIGLGVRLW